MGWKRVPTTAMSIPRAASAMPDAPTGELKPFRPSTNIAAETM
jgi:hypothetical protein